MPVPVGQQASPIDTPVDFFISDTFDANLNATPNNDTLTLSPSGTPNEAVQTDPAGETVDLRHHPDAVCL